MRQRLPQGFSQMNHADFSSESLNRLSGENGLEVKRRLSWECMNSEPFARQNGIRKKTKGSRRGMTQRERAAGEKKTRPNPDDP